MARLSRGDVLKGQYTIVDVLGAGSNATTYKATTLDGRVVAVKALSLTSLRDWKQLDLFQREAQVLAGLSHPAIPRYIDYFEEDSERDRAFYIVQEAVAGRSLADMVSSGARASDQEAMRIAEELLRVLQYLGQLRPPVVHRDVKPENIVLEGGSWGGRVFLVDFGGVQGAASASETLASTIVGTYGYMAPEQFRGAAQPASDLYALGGTLLYLLSGQAPFAFPQERMRIEWRKGMSPPSARWAQLLDGLLEPVAEDRLSADEALAVLQGQPVRSRPAGSTALRGTGAREALVPPRNATEAYMRMSALAPAPVKSKPAGSRVQLERTTNRLDVLIPPKGLGMDTAFTGAFALVWNGFVAVWTVGALASGGLLFALFSVPFWFAGAQLARQTMAGALTRERLAVGRSKFRIGQELALFSKDGSSFDFQGGQNEKVVEGSTEQLLGARVITTMFVNDNPVTAIELLEGVNKFRFGEGLETAEQQWLVWEINSAVEEIKGAPLDYAAFPAPEMPRTYRDDPNSTSSSAP